MSKTTERIEQAIQNQITSMGYEIVDVEIAKEGKDKILYVYITKGDGILLEDCEKVSRAIDPIIDELDPIEDSYFLCVSSPGLERKFKRARDYERNLGEMVEVSLYSPYLGKKKYIGALQAFNESAMTFELQTDEGSITFDVKDTSAVRLHIDFSDLPGGN